MIKNLTVVLTLGVFFISCDSGKFTKDIDISTADNERILVVNATFFPKVDTQIVMTITEGFFLDEVAPETIEDLKPLDFSFVLRNETSGITLFEGDTSDCNIVYMKADAETFKPGNRYSLLVKVKGKETTWSEVIMPESPAVRWISYDSLENLYTRIKFNLEDKSDENEHFNIHLSRTHFLDGERYEEGPSEPDVENVLFTEGYRSSVLSDETFANEGINIDFDVFLWDFGADSTWVDLYISSWTEDYYRYDRSLLTVDLANDFPLSEPSTIYSNFSNSFGIFAIGSTGTDRLVIR